MLRRIILSVALSCSGWAQVQPGMWTFSNRPYFDPLHAEPRAAQTQVLFPAVSTGFPFAVKNGRHMAWDVNLGKELPIFGWETRRIEDVDGVGPGQFGIGVWFPLSFHIVEDMGKDPSNPILNTDYRFGGMVKGQFGLWAKKGPAQRTTAGFRFHFGHESTHIGDEFTLGALREHKDFLRVNVSYEFWDLAGSLEPKFGCDGEWVLKLRGGMVRVIDQKKGWYSSELLHPYPSTRTLLPSKRNYEPYFGLEFGKTSDKPGLFTSIDLRNRTVYDYAKTNPAASEDAQLSVNWLVGWKQGPPGQGVLGKIRPAYFIRIYHGVNPAGQFRSQRDYTLIGFGVQFF